MNNSCPWILASQNAGKLKELRVLLSEEKIDVRLSPYPLEVEETGETFHENARLKAEAFSQTFQASALADDSGLVIPALNGQPGIHSARWATSAGGYRAAFSRLENALANIPSPDAYFICVLCLFIPTQEPVYFEGRLYGHIRFPPCGQNGFGYDPIFVPEGYDVTCAELSPEEKNRISHRAMALKQLKQYLSSLTVP